MKKSKAPKKISTSWLRKIGLPATLIPGIILAAGLGWAGWQKWGSNYYANKSVFPSSGLVKQVIDGDTFVLASGVTVRLIGVDAPNRGDENEATAKQDLGQLVENKKVYLEYDRYQNDKYGRILAWVWINCGFTPKFLPADYMHLSANQSHPGLVDNPGGCKQGLLVQEELYKRGAIWIQNYSDRGELKYERRLAK
ncbi:MAG: thermonuclease family protein [bacterium]|nr:thermonuclease family protein [bacterium]